MNIRILHLYSDVMNLYGEYANVLIMKKYLTDLGHNVCVDNLELYEQGKINNSKTQLSEYDFYYMGSGSEKKLLTVAKDIKAYRDDLFKAYNEDKVLLFTGNAMEILGTTIKDKNENEYDGLAFANFETTLSDKRITCDCIAKCTLENEVVGFINKCSTIKGIKNPLFSLSMGKGNDNQSNSEGFLSKNLFATHITGPIIVRNPFFMRYLADKILARYEITTDENVIYPPQEDAYKVCLEELKKRLSQ